MSKNNITTPGAYRVDGSAAAAAHGPLMRAEAAMTRKKQMCWKCQKDKPLKGGEIKMLMGMVPGTPRKFICADCVAARSARNAT